MQLKMDENLYHQIQYDRIDHLETRRENFSNYILTISTAIMAITLGNTKELSTFSAFLIFLFGFLINLIAILFIKSTMPFIKMHQTRAEEIRKEYDPRLSKVNDSVLKPMPILKFGKKIYECKRHNLYILLHCIFIIIFAAITIYSIVSEKEVFKPVLVKIIK